MGRFIASLLLPGSGHLIRWRFARGLAWFGFVTLLTLPIPHVTAPWLPILFAIFLAAAVDATVIDEGPRTRNRTLPLLGLATFAILYSAVIRAQFVEAFRIPSGSMIPTILPGDHIITRKRDFVHTPPARGDVIVFTYKARLGGASFVKRVIGIAGDTVEIRDNQILVNGTAVPRTAKTNDCTYQDLDDTTNHWDTHRCHPFTETTGTHTYSTIQDDPSNPRSWPQITVPANQLYVLGDNRDNSHDSRYFGPIPIEEVKAVVAQVYWSNGEGIRWERMGRGWSRKAGMDRYNLPVFRPTQQLPCFASVEIRPIGRLLDLAEGLFQPLRGEFPID